MTTTNSVATGAALLRHLRESRGWSWSDLARALRAAARQLAVASLMDRQVMSIQRTVARWESLTDRTSPGDRYQFLLAYLYARKPDGDLALGPGSDFDMLLDALRHFGTSSERIRQLTDLITKRLSGDGELWAGVLPMQSSVSATLRVDEELLGQLSATVGLVNCQVGSVPFVRLQLRLGPIVDTCRRLLLADQTGPRNELPSLATDAYALAARLAFETRDDETAMSLYTEATGAARRLGDPSRLAAVRTSHTMVILHGTDDPEAARKLARTATVDAHHGSSYAVRARAHAVHAEVCARAGQANEAFTALDRAWKTVGQLTVDDPHGGFTAGRLTGFDGLCALHAGDAERAHDGLSRSLASLDQPRDTVQRGIVSADVALTRLRLGDPAACVELLHGAVDITAATNGRVSAKRIMQARRELRPWRSEYFLADLDDHIHDTLLMR